MSFANIVDHRTNKYNVKVDAVFEPACHDNSITGSTRFRWTYEFQVSELYKTTVAKAVAHADKWKCPVTIYLYDHGFNPVGAKGKLNG